jgi:hypothetical protein
VGKLIGVIATILVAIGAATGVTVAVDNASSPDKSVNLQNPDAPNNGSSGGGGSSSSGSVNYGTAG